MGVLLFTLVYGEVPYPSEDIMDGSFVETCKRKDGKYGLRRKKASKEVQSLINSLLRYKPAHRLGYNSINDIKKHEFFADFDWDGYSTKQIENPIADIVALFSTRNRIRRRNLSTPGKL